MRDNRKLLICRRCKRLAPMPDITDTEAPLCCGERMMPRDSCIMFSKGKKITFKKDEDEGP